MTAVEVVQEKLSAADYTALRQRVGWPALAPTAVGAGLSRSLCTVSARHETTVIGCGRVVGDGALYFYLQDVMVDPAWQRRGVGSRIIAELLGYIEQHAAEGACVGLLAASGLEGLYRRFGFIPRPPDAPGMYFYLHREVSSERSPSP